MLILLTFYFPFLKKKIGHENQSLGRCFISPDNNTLAFTLRDGVIALVSRFTKRLIGSLKMNGTVRTLDFSPDGRQIASIGRDGQVYRWDVGERTCISNFWDEGTVKPTTIAWGPNDFLTTG